LANAIEEVAMKQRIVFTAALVLVLLLGIAGQSRAIVMGTTPQDAETLVGDTPMTGMVVGNRAGSFGYYRIEYPGNEDVVNIRVTFLPGDPATMTGVGFNVYGDQGALLGEGSQRAEPGLVELMYSSETAETWLVQVYNYIPEHTVWFEIVAEGLPVAPAVTPTPVAPAVTPTPVVTPTPTEPEPVVDRRLTPGAIAAGTLVGSRAGSFSLYELAYPGDDSDVPLTLWFWPADPTLEPRMGFNVYDPTGRLVAQGTIREELGKVATLSTDVPGIYTVQVYNYNEGLPMEYTLSR
jgi:hypothetical protein